MIAGKSAVRESLKPGEIVGEPPAFPIRTVNELVHYLPQLPGLFTRVSELEKLNDVEEWPSPTGSWRERVLPLLARTLRVQPEVIDDEMDLKEEFNADSLTVLTVVTEIESEFEITIPDSDVRKMRTLNSIVNYLETNFSSITAEE
jgi:acyl carrier protein